MRSAFPTPRWNSHFSGWMFSGRPLIEFEIVFCFTYSRMLMLPASLTLRLTSRPNLAGGRRSSDGHTA
ncbi:hypothetical protein D3C81_2315570 [compost metagenome]